MYFRWIVYICTSSTDAKMKVGQSTLNSVRDAGTQFVGVEEREVTHIQYFLKAVTYFRIVNQFAKMFDVTSIQSTWFPLQQRKHARQPHSHLMNIEHTKKVRQSCKTNQRYSVRYMEGKRAINSKRDTAERLTGFWCKAPSRVMADLPESILVLPSRRRFNVRQPGRMQT